MKQCYTEQRFSPATAQLLYQVNDIIDDYQEQGFRLTVRQLYYQLVAAAIVPNTLQSYKRVASIINDGKHAGVVDWDAIEDRTREFARQQRWNGGAQILQAAIDSYHQDMWVHQDHRVFVIVEKEALVGVLEPTCRKFDVPLLAARGYPSGTVLREFVESDILPCFEEEKTPIILHLGDHDPSGIDMSRDLTDRITLFAGQPVELKRIALNMQQVRAIRPPENPAKVTDSRFDGYLKQFGTKSWELDALSPTYLAKLLTTEIEEYIHGESWDEIAFQVEHVRGRLGEVAQEFS